MSLLTIFVRQEPTTDELSLKAGLKHRKDVVAYRDRECTKHIARWGWFLTTRPRARQPTAMLNCFRWKLEWLDSAKEAAQ